jgi:tetratricopeptide (TPR) repeat protein
LKKAILLAMPTVFIFPSICFAALSSNSAALKYYAGAVSFHKKKDFKNAMMYYNAAIKKDRKFWQAWLELGICYYSMAKYRNAKLIFQFVLNLKPNQPLAKKYYDIMSPKKNTDSAGLQTSRNKGDLVWRSALLPGFRQFYNGQTAKGYIYSLAYVASIAAIIKYTIDQNDAVAAYNNANTDFDAKYKTASDMKNKVIIPIAAAGTVWAVSVIDAFISGKDEEPARAGKTVEIRYDNGIVIAYNFAQISF